MNHAQINLKALLAQIPEEETKEREFIQKCYEAWDGYDDMGISYPHWTLKALEEKYNLEVADIYNKYN